MSDKLHRRKFLSSIAALPSLAMLSIYPIDSIARESRNMTTRLKTSLNAFSFNDALLKGSMDINDMLEFCAAAGFDAVDITGYYFKGYPAVPSDDYLFHIKRNAFNLGLEISGTGVRNDFTIADKDKRRQEVDLVKKWIVVAAKIGAPVIRIFSGTQKNEAYSKKEVTDWMLDDIRTCVDYGKQHGIVIGLQNHNDFIQTADEINYVIETINSEWLGLILDTGSYRVHDPYEEITKSIKHAVNWQIKEKMFIKGEEVDTDMNKLMTIIKSSGYNGYLPIETLGAGDPKTKIMALFEKLRKALA